MMHLYWAFAAGVISTIALEFLLALVAAWWANRELKRADTALKKYGPHPWASAPKPEIPPICMYDDNAFKEQNLMKIEQYIKAKFKDKI